MIAALLSSLMACAPRYNHLPALSPADITAPLPTQSMVVDTASLAGVRIAYIDSRQAGIQPRDPDATPLVFVHGLSSSMGFWEYQLNHLAAERRVLALDLPGYGASSRPDAPYTPPWYSEVLTAWLDQLGLDRVVIVGHSMGGQVALTFALRHEDRVAGLVLAAPAGFERFSTGEAAWMKNYWHEERALEAREDELRATFTQVVFNHHDEGVERLLRERVQLGRDPSFRGTSVAVSRSIAGMLDYPVIDRLGEIRAPTLIVFGKDDRMIPNPVFTGGRTETIAKIGRDAIDGAQLVMLPGAGHMVQHDDPEGFNQALLWFLAGQVHTARQRPAPTGSTLSDTFGDAVSAAVSAAVRDGASQ
ncbi:MAG: alpha/beta hydrolase [Oligoflexia bacterium]|nr:alpha/beta hydrolase [Oligoflexia bacterium]